MKSFRTLMLSIFLLLLILNLNMVLAFFPGDVNNNINETNCTGDLCLVNYTEEEIVEEEIDCENFMWVENYIKEELNKENASVSKVELVNILKNTNYNLQDDLNECESKLKRYFYGFWATLIILIIIMLYVWLRVNKALKN